ncbi:MAG TPA: Flp family type IVb pilin [Bryobacteraceae bacterium]|nr:Flp family type IVb pilin [Bryobacteraceae bacterium]
MDSGTPEELMYALLSGLLRIVRDQRGQDMIEYALLAAAIAIIVAGFLPPSVMPSVSTIFSKLTSSMAIS